MAKFKLKNRKLFLGLGALVLAVLGVGFVFTSFFSNPSQTKALNYLSPFYQYYNNINTDHLYITYYPPEARFRDYGFQKTQGYVAFDGSCVASLVALKRYYSSTDISHFYTTGSTVPTGYVLEGTVGYISSTQIDNTTPLYKYYNATLKDYFYTITKDELGVDYVYQGIEGYIFSSQVNICSDSLQVTKNPAYPDQIISPNNSNVKIGSFVVLNPSTSQSVRLASLVIDTKTTTVGIGNFSSLKLTINSPSYASTPIAFSGTANGTTSTDVFPLNQVIMLAPGASSVIDIYANTGSGPNGTITETLTVRSDSKTATRIDPVKGQTLVLGKAVIVNPPTLKATASDTTPSQFILGGTTAGSKATYNFVSVGGSSTITELTFNIVGSDADPTQTVSKVCVGSKCAVPISLLGFNLVDLTLSLAVPNGGNGLDQAVQISYSGVGTNGVAPSSTSTLSLIFVKYTTAGTTKTLGTAAICAATSLSCDATLAPEVKANTMTMVGSLPVVTLAAGNSQNLNADTVVARTTIANATGSSTRIRTIVFNLAYSGFNTLPTSLASSSLTDSTGNVISTFTCTNGGVSSGAVTVTCTNTTATYATDYPIGSTPQEFDLHVTTSGAANTTGTPKVSTTLGKSTFKWDDTSTNGGVGSTELTGTLIYSFPTMSVNN